jgi:hypothetical protein
VPLLGWISGLSLLFLLGLWAFLCANKEEPVLGNKEIYLQRLEQCTLPLFTQGSRSIVKPSHATSVGMGVDFHSSSWTLSKCQDLLGVPCMMQPYHPGPWEVRLYKSKEWQDSVAWNVPCEEPMCTEPIPLKVNFSWQTKLQECIDAQFPHTQFMAVDVRSNGDDVLVLEINGAFGMPYAWATDLDSKTSVIVNHLRWITDRVHSGLYQLSVERLLSLLFLGVERQLMTKTKGKIWF